MISGFTTRDGATGGRARDDAQRLATGLGEAVDGRIGADERGVDGLGEQGLDCLGAGVEGRRLQRDVVVECLDEDVLFKADDRRSMSDVGEVAEPEGDGLAATTRFR